MSEEKHARIADGREVALRPARTPDDVDGLMVLYSRLSPAARSGLHYDVMNREFVASRLAQVDGHNHWREVALHDGRIVAEASLDRESLGWARHVAEFRAVVDPDFDLKGCRHLLCERLIDHTRRSGIERLIVEVLADQSAHIKVFQRLGFELETIRRAYAKGSDGRLHDLAILSNDLEGVWRQLEQHLADMDGCFPLSRREV